MSNPTERDTIHGHAGSADPESYRARRQGNLVRASDGFRSPTLSTDPRRETYKPYKPDPPLAPYAYNTASPGVGARRNIPRTWAYLRTATPGAPHVGFPDATRTQGKLQASGAAWGKVGEAARAQLTPPVDGRDAPPSHVIGKHHVEGTFSMGPRWKWPTVPAIYSREAGHRTVTRHGG